jgi:glycosyltransferase involved in cell wall biosynthesis
MKAAVFFDGYSPLHETKDPGLITIGLGRLGDIATLVTEAKGELDDYKAPFPIVMANEKNRFKDINFWRRINADIVICYTWVDPAYNSIVEAIRKSGKKVLVKADTDGRLGYPVVPREYRLKHRHATATFALKLWYKFYRLKGKIEQLEAVSGVLVETPKAYQNIERFLECWGRPDLLSKFHVVPNPVTDDITMAELAEKQNVLISVARWNDPAKNTSMMLRCSKKFLEDNPDWTLRLVGPAEHVVKQGVSEWKGGLRDRVEITGFVPHERMARLLDESRVLFVPSNWESFCIAAAEAVCMGCTVVGTPLEPLDFLVAGGFSGTLAEDFAFEHLMQALASDASKHKQGNYNPIEIADYWRPRLSIREVVSQIHKLLTKL